MSCPLASVASHLGVGFQNQSNCLTISPPSRGGISFHGVCTACRLLLSRIGPLTGGRTGPTPAPHVSIATSRLWPHLFITALFCV